MTAKLLLYLLHLHKYMPELQVIGKVVVKLLITLPTVGVQSVAISVSVCLSVRSHVSKTTCPNFTKFSVRVRPTRGRGSVFL